MFKRYRDHLPPEENLFDLFFVGAGAILFALGLALSLDYCTPRRPTVTDVPVWKEVEAPTGSDVTCWRHQVTGTTVCSPKGRGLEC